MLRFLLTVALCASADAFSVAPSALDLRAPVQICSARRVPRHGALRMADKEPRAEGDVSGSSPVPDFVNKSQDSWWSRNRLEEIAKKPGEYDSEAPGDFLAGADRMKPEDSSPSEELTGIEKWQRTMGPIYILRSSGGFIAAGFVDYFLLGNPGDSASIVWTLGFCAGLIGPILNRRRPEITEPFVNSSE
mmetsp:Transcript_51238/g.121957  ORF Transcript_51238/g.121957 Transcript_51238/m.121957 type:complete len:190 (-) Transcript_51238:41-610(-)